MFEDASIGAKISMPVCEGQQKTYERYSAVVPVYYKESPRNLNNSISSIYAQSIPPSETILVCDGPLTVELDSAIEKLTATYGSLRVLRLEENKGAAVANERGVALCQNDLIEKLGSDDICCPMRAEVLLKEFERNPSLAVVGGYMQAYRVTPGDCDEIREVPTDPMEIIKYARRRSPFDDATVIVRKSAIESVGGYDPNMVRAQDYDLYSRILQAGYPVKNIGVVLTYFQEDEDAFLRRKTLKHTRCFIRARWRILRRGGSGIFDFLVPCASQILIMLLPNPFLISFYKRFLRKKEKAETGESEMPVGKDPIS